MTVIPIRKQEADDPLPMWIMVSAFADDDTRPLPRDKDQLLELSEMLMEASRKVRMAMVRVQEELMSG